MSKDVAVMNDVPVVRVTRLAGDSMVMDYTPGMTLQDYLNNAGVKVQHGEVVTLNGATVDGNPPVTPNSVVVVAGRIANG